MSKKKPRRNPIPKRNIPSLAYTDSAIQQIALREHTTPDMVRKHIQISTLNGLTSQDPRIQAVWQQIPRAGEIPTPYEVIAYCADALQQE